MNRTTHWFSWLKSNDKVIIDILENQISNLVSATGALVELIATYDNVNERKFAIKDLEHSGDKIAHSIFDIFDKTFVTPFDREDISKLPTRQIKDAAGHSPRYRFAGYLDTGKS
jgi:hypothetical protein